MNIEEAVADIQRQFDENAKLNDTPPEMVAEAFAHNGKVWWRGRHWVTGKMVTAQWGAI